MLSKKPGPRTRCTSTQACRTDDATASTSPAGSSKFLASLASWRSIPSHRLAHAKRCGLAASSAALADGFPAGNRSNPLRRGTRWSDILELVCRLTRLGSATWASWHVAEGDSERRLREEADLPPLAPFTLGPAQPPGYGPQPWKLSQ